MGLYTFLQHRMARFVMEVPKISEQAQYTIHGKPKVQHETATHDLQVKKYQTMQPKETDKSIESEQEPLYYVLNVENNPQTKKKKSSYFHLHKIPGKVYKSLKALILSSSSKKTHFSTEELVDQIIETIKSNQLDPSKILLKGINSAQTEQIREAVNLKLEKEGLAKLPIIYRYVFKPVHVAKYVPCKNSSQYEAVVLDTLFVKPENPSGKYIINCAARGRTYLDWIKDLSSDAEASNATMVGFNYRGIGKSTGTIITQQDVIDDIIAQVKHLIQDKNVHPKDICLYGLCLGGGFAALAAAQLKKENIEVKLYLSRSFKQFDNVIIDLLFPRKYDKWYILVAKLIFFIPILIVAICFKIYSKILGWDVNAKKALNEINPDNIECDFAEPTKKDKSAGYCSDKLISSSKSPYTIIQKKLSATAHKKADDLLLNGDLHQGENKASTRAEHLLGLELAHLRPQQGKWTEEESLEMLLEVEKVMTSLQADLKDESLTQVQRENVQRGLKHYQTIHEGLSLARTNLRTSHQLIRSNPEEKSYNPHSCSSDKVKAYGFAGTQRHRLAWFVNRSAAIEQKEAINSVGSCSSPGEIISEAQPQLAG